MVTIKSFNNFKHVLYEEHINKHNEFCEEINQKVQEKSKVKI
jgi:hypothetical protein